MRELSIWETFGAVYEQRNLSRAARHLHVSQPALSHAIQSLEAQYGVPLFLRTNRGVTPTAAGDALYRYAQTICGAVEESRTAVIAASEGTAGELVIGASLTIADYILPAPLAAFSRANARIRVRIDARNTADISRLLVEEQIRLAFVEAPLYDMRLVQTPFLEDRLGAVAPRTHWLARAGSARIRDMLHEPLLVRERGSGTRAVLEAALRARDMRLEDFRVRVESSSPSSIVSLVAQGMGVAILSEWVVRGIGVERGVVFVPVEDLSLSRHLLMVHRREDPLDLLTRRFISTVETVVRRNPAPDIPQ